MTPCIKPDPGSDAALKFFCDLLDEQNTGPHVLDRGRNSVSGNSSYSTFILQMSFFQCRFESEWLLWVCGERYSLRILKNLIREVRRTPFSSCTTLCEWTVCVSCMDIKAVCYKAKHLCPLAHFTLLLGCETCHILYNKMQIISQCMWYSVVPWCRATIVSEYLYTRVI